MCYYFVYCKNCRQGVYFRFTTSGGEALDGLVVYCTNCGETAHKQKLLEDAGPNKSPMRLNLPNLQRGWGAFARLFRTRERSTTFTITDFDNSSINNNTINFNVEYSSGTTGYVYEWTTAS